MPKLTVEQKGKAMVLLGTFDEFDIDDIIEVLWKADHLYHNDEESFLEDNEYDALRKYAEACQPYDIYFTGVGSNVRGGKVKLPYQMGSLDQIEIGDIEKWITTNDLKDEVIIPTEKLDGISAMIIYDDDGMFQIAYSRGDGIQGADISRHVRRLVPNEIENGGESFVIRGEIIISKKNFPIIQSKVRTSGGKEYKNARNMVAGCMNASSREEVVYDYIDFVAYQIVKPDDALSRSDQLYVLKTMGFKTAKGGYYGLFGREIDDDVLAELLNELREQGEYEIDGLVLDVDSLITRERMNPTRNTLNPAYAIKYKVADASNQAIAIVKKVHWNVSKHGFLKPRVEIEPVELVGVTVKHATGFNAKFISVNTIGPGAKVRITRSGDVIPFIQAVVKKADEADMPDVDWAWNDTAVDAVLLGYSEDVTIKRLTDFFASIDAPLLKEGNVVKIFDAGIDSIEEIIQMTEDQLVEIIGANGSKIYSGLQERLTDIPLYVLLGSHATARGIGKRKMKKLQQALGIAGLLVCRDEGLIADQDGFDQKTATKVVHCLNQFVDFYAAIKDYVTIAEDADTSGGAMEGEKIVFTGFRDKELQALVEAEGGEMQSGVSGKTTILVASNPTSNSGKMKKARDKGVRVLGIDEFKDLL